MSEEERKKNDAFGEIGKGFAENLRKKIGDDFAKPKPFRVGGVATGLGLQAYLAEKHPLKDGETREQQLARLEAEIKMLENKKVIREENEKIIPKNPLRKSKTFAEMEDRQKKNSPKNGRG